MELSVGLVDAAPLRDSRKVVTLFNKHKQSSGMLTVLQAKIEDIRTWMRSHSGRTGDAMAYEQGFLRGSSGWIMVLGFERNGKQ